MYNKNIPIWRTRIKSKTSSTFQKVSSSIETDKRLFKEDILASIAHVEMLNRQKIISFKIKNKIIWGLNKIRNQIIKKKYLFNYQDEDIHMSIEKKLFELIGEDAGYIHTARSRNDQVLVDFKMWMINSNNKLIKILDQTINNILKIAEKNIYTIMPGFTHLKNAQPISFAHYILAYVEMFSRDRQRLKNNFTNLKENPLGSGALSGTSFNIDRNFTTKKLGFNVPTSNSIDTVSNRDFVLDFLFASSVCAMHISRFAEEFIIWNSDGFRLITLNDNIVTGSSIMPQKKNPDPLEFLRGKVSNSYGNLFSMMTILKGLPLSYFKDLQDDKKIVFDTFDNLIDSIKVLNEVLKNFSVNKIEMLNLAKRGHITATDLADYLVKNLNYPFRKSYQITAKIVNYCEKNKKNLSDLSYKELKVMEPNIKQDVIKIFDLYNSVNSKKSYAGTSFENVKKMIKKYKNA
jgi:argininosuccinate lyase|tara:strand:+ start:3707 stop:5089 length:1383 start_codon:yes stop_codon:yes gene_type:complete